MKKYIRKFIVCNLTVLLALITSCSKDDETGSSYSFEDQNLQGSIEGIPFDFKDGIVGDGFDEDEFSISLINETESEDEACNLFGREKVFILFSVPNQVGVYELSFSFSGSENQTISLVDNESDDIPLTIVATEGAIEILSISDTQITGRIDARSDEINFVNGNFTADFCE